MMGFEHIAARFIIHFFSAAGVFQGMMNLQCYGRAKWDWFPRLRGWNSFIFSAFVPFAFICMWEIWDVAEGGWVYKSVIDWFSWASGFAAAIVGRYYERGFTWERVKEIHFLRACRLARNKLPRG